MSLRKRGGIWWVDVVAPNGERIRRTAGTANKALAQEFHDRVKSELWRIAQIGREAAADMERCGGAVAQGTVAQGDRQGRCQPSFDGWTRTWAARSSPRSIAPSIDRITDAKLAQGRSNATVNRTLELLRAILRKCVNEWEWLDRAPQVRMLKEPTRRIRFLTREEAQRLLAELPEHLADMAAFSLATGLRAANVTGLQWSQVDLARRLAWIHPDQAKARRAIAVPLNAEAVALVHEAGREARDARVQLSGQAGNSGEHEGLVCGTGAGRDRRFSLARSAAYLGELARAERHAAVRAAGDGGLGERRRWCGVTRTSPRITWRPMRNASVRCGPWSRRITAQIRHRPENERARIAASP